MLYGVMSFNKQVIDILCTGGVACLPTDTIYGVLAVTGSIEAVKKVYFIKDRSPTKPCIILVSDPKQLLDFGVDSRWITKTSRYWPGPNSLIIPTSRSDIDYLTCGMASLAFRLPADSELIALINQTGPLIAPSANPESLPPATNIDEAKNYFGDKVDIYVDGGYLPNARPSKLIDLATDKVLR